MLCEDLLLSGLEQAIQDCRHQIVNSISTLLVGELHQVIN